MLVVCILCAYGAEEYVMEGAAESIPASGPTWATGPSGPREGREGESCPSVEILCN
jgi:hypothetical protein